MIRWRRSLQRGAGKFFKTYLSLERERERERDTLTMLLE